MIFKKKNLKFCMDYVCNEYTKNLQFHLSKLHKNFLKIFFYKILKSYKITYHYRFFMYVPKDNFKFKN